MAEEIAVYASGDQETVSRILLKGGKIVNADIMFEGDVLIEGSKIKQVGKILAENNEKTKVINCSGKLIIPGGIDLNTSIAGKSTGIVSIDDFQTGSRAALKGGTTTIFNSIEMNDDSNSLISNYLTLKEKASKIVLCNLGVTINIYKFNDNIANEIKVLIHDFGVTLFKLDFADSRVQLTDGDLYDLCCLIRKYGAILFVQGGNGLLSKKIYDELYKNDITGPEGFIYSYNNEIIWESIHRLITLSNITHCPMVFLGCNSVAVLEKLSREKNGIIYSDLMAPSLVIGFEQIIGGSWNSAASSLSYPPMIEDRRSRVELKNGIVNGTVDLVGSGHKKFLLSQKKIGINDFRKVPCGIPAVKERLKLVWDVTVKHGLVDACKFVALTSMMPAQLANIYPSKGVIKEEADADIVVWDPNYINETLDGDEYNLYGTLSTPGNPTTVIIGGKLAVLESCDVIDTDGLGQVLKLQAFGQFVYNNVQQRMKITATKLKSIERVLEDEEIIDSKDKETDLLVPKVSRRPLTKCGGRNMQDSTFSLSGSQVDDATPIRSSIRTNQPPGGKSTSLW